MRLPKKQRPKTWSYKTWYATNKEGVNERRRTRYQQDPTYRERVKEASRATRARTAKIKKPENRKPRKRGFAKPKIVQAGDQLCVLENVSALLRETGLHRITYNRWNESGVLPNYHWTDEHGRRWYPRAFVEFVKRLLEKRIDEKTVGGQSYWLGNFRTEAAILWTRLKKKMPDLSQAREVDQED